MTIAEQISNNNKSWQSREATEESKKSYAPTVLIKNDMYRLKATVTASLVCHFLGGLEYVQTQLGLIILVFSMGIWMSV